MENLKDKTEEEKTKEEPDSSSSSAAAAADSSNILSESNEDKNINSGDCVPCGNTSPESVPTSVAVTSEPEAPTVPRATRISIEELEATEMKVRIMCLEKNNMALKMELKCAELQVSAKLKVDAQKTRLIELLDKKVESLEKKNTHLIEMLEGLIKDKDTHSHRLIDATKHMEDLSKRLQESERMRSELRAMNQELKVMLGNIEDKGSQIAKMAKEKVLKYKEESLNLQQQLDDIKTDKENTEMEAALNKENSSVATTRDGAAGGDRTDRFQPHWNRIAALQQQLASAFQGANVECLVQNVTTVNKDMKHELEQLRLELNSVLNCNQEENEKLRVSLNNIKKEILDLENLCKESIVTPVEEQPSSSTTSADTTIPNRPETSELQELQLLKSAVLKLASSVK